MSKHGDFVLILRLTKIEIKTEVFMLNSFFLSTLLNIIPDCVFVKSKEGVYLDCNHEFLKITGKTREEIIGKTDYDLFNKDLADFFRENDLLALECNHWHINNETVTYPDGRTAFFNTRKTPLKDDNGNILGFLGFSRDITEQKNHENQLIRIGERFEQITKQSGSVVWEVDTDGLYTYVCDSCTDLWGYRPDELVNKMHF